LSRAIEAKSDESEREILQIFAKGLELLDDYDHEELDRIGNTKTETIYPTLEEKAANLLYFIVKNHSFIDGNKRIGAACFLYFLERNGILIKANKSIISNATLATLTLFIASSQTSESETVKHLIISILNRSNK